MFGCKSTVSDEGGRLCPRSDLSCEIALRSSRAKNVGPSVQVEDCGNLRQHPTVCTTIRTLRRRSLPRSSHSELPVFFQMSSRKRGELPVRTRRPMKPKFCSYGLHGNLICGEWNHPFCCARLHTPLSRHDAEWSFFPVILCVLPTLAPEVRCDT
jgi:hypothetical protein